MTGAARGFVYPRHPCPCGKIVPFQSATVIRDTRGNYRWLREHKAPGGASCEHSRRVSTP